MFTIMLYSQICFSSDMIPLRMYMEKQGFSNSEFHKITDNSVKYYVALRCSAIIGAFIELTPESHKKATEASVGPYRDYYSLQAFTLRGKTHPNQTTAENAIATAELYGKIINNYSNYTEEAFASRGTPFTAWMDKDYEICAKILTQP